MSSMSWIHWAIVLAYVLLLGVPGVLVARRAGFHPAFGILAAVPILNLLAFWLLATVRWPALHSR